MRPLLACLLCLALPGSVARADLQFNIWRIAATTTTTTTTTTTAAPTTTTTLGPTDYTQRDSCKGLWLIGGAYDCTGAGDTACEDYCDDTPGAGSYSQGGADPMTTGGDPAHYNTSLPANVGWPTPYGLDLVLGSSQYAARADSTTEFESTNYTVSLWAYIDACAGGAAYGLWAKAGAGSTEYVNEIYESSGCLIDSYCGSDGWTTSAASVSTGAWTHLAFVTDDSAMKVYVNGAETTLTGGCNTSNYASTMGPQIGRYNTAAAGAGTWYYFDGKVFEVAYFNEALTANDIREICECGVAGNNTSARSCASYDSRCD